MPNTPNAKDVYGFVPRRKQEIQTVSVPYPALALDDNGEIPSVGFHLTRYGLTMNEQVIYSDWLEVGRAMFTIESSLQMAIGDWINIGGDEFDCSIEAIAEVFGKEVKTLQNWAAVAKASPYSLRKENLTLSHYNLLVRYSFEQKAEIYELASRAGWTVDQLRNFLKPKSGRKKLTPLQKVHGVFLKGIERAQSFTPDERFALASELERMAMALRGE